MHEQSRLNITHHFNRFQSEKKRRDDSIRNLRSELLQTRNR
jgi:hypothetical protein